MNKLQRFKRREKFNYFYKSIPTCLKAAKKVSPLSYKAVKHYIYRPNGWLDMDLFKINKTRFIPTKYKTNLDVCNID